MASPTRAELEAQWVNMVTLLNEARKFANVNASNWVGLEDTYAQSVESDFAPAQLSAVAAARSFLAGLLGSGTAAGMHLPLIQAYARHVVNATSLADAQAMIDKMYRYMVDNSLTVKSRTFTFANPSAGGGNVGNGSYKRLNTDEYNFSIENQHPDGKIARCVYDQNSGTGVGEEIFEVYGQAPGPDGLQVSGSGKRSLIAAMSGRNSLLSNTSFDQFSGTTSAPTDITSWTSSITVNGTNYALDPTNYYRKFQGSTPYALQMNATGTLTQKLSTYNTKLRPDIPYMLQLSWNRTVGAATGTLQANLGSINNSVAVVAQAGWQQLLVPSSFGQNCWLKNFNQDDLSIVISWTRTGGNILFDDMLLIPGTPFDGGWIWIVGGSTAFLKNDVWTYTDSATDPGLVNYWLWRAYGRYLPSTTGAASWSGS